MSIALVLEFAQELPPRLRESVIGYARSVEDALPDIFRDAELRPDQGLADQLVFRGPSGHTSKDCGFSVC